MHVLATSFLALYLVHLVTDFVRQSDRAVIGKETRIGSVLPGAWRNPSPCGSVVSGVSRSGVVEEVWVLWSVGVSDAGALGN